MRLSNFKSLMALLGLLIFNACSDGPDNVYTMADFEGRIFSSETYGSNLRARLHFLQGVNELVATDIPWGIDFSNKYEILMGNVSPSGKPTISVDSLYYFVISGKNKLIYRYYEGASEKTIVFKEIRQ